MKLELNVQHSTHGYKFTCCNGKDIKITKSNSGRVFTEMNLKCNKCGKKAYFKYWHYESIKPTKEEKELGYKREVKRTNYIFNVE